MLFFTMIAPLVLIYFTASYELSVESVITAGVGNSIGFDKKILQQSLWQASLLLFFIAAVFSWFATLVFDRYRRVQQMQQHQVQSLKAEIAALSEADKALQEAKQIAESANQAKSRYLSGISHELRSPLNSLLGYAQLIEKDHQLRDKNRDSMRIIRRSGEYLADLIEGLLDISKIEAGRLEILPTEVQFPALLEQIVSMFQLQADKKGIEFSYNFSHRLPEYVRVDEKQLRQILINLLSNAIKFTAEGYVCFNVDYKSETAIFTVEDSGRGIAEEDQERVFSPFEQVHNQTFSYVPGTGLGLTITRLLTEIMGGDITLTSELGKGSVFRVQLLMSSVIEPKLMSVSEKDIEGITAIKNY
ncbi:MAG: ATP-binding protein [Pseudomonadales bacterium]|nr:ATP-binding protein [Pseudomonadales bacterium]